MMRQGDAAKELRDLLKLLTEEVKTTRVQFLLSDTYDSCDAILSIHSGAGGTEARIGADAAEDVYEVDGAETLCIRYCRLSAR